MSERVFGIDLGTTYSAIAYIDDMGLPQLIQNFDGAHTTPSVVYFEEDGSTTVGQQAKNEAAADPDNTVALIKRDMGLSGPEAERFVRDKTYKPEMISAIILRRLVQDAKDTLGEDCNKVVITVPAYFGLTEKEATKAAGEIAHLDVVDIIQEPVAAAVAEGFDFGDIEETILVYDLGGGTFDCTIMQYVPGDGIRVLAVDGDRNLGGADWDSALYDIALEKFTALHGDAFDSDPNDDPAFVGELRFQVEEGKKALSQRDKTKIRVSFGDFRESVEVTRAEFDQATSHLLNRTI